MGTAGPAHRPPPPASVRPWCPSLQGDFLARPGWPMAPLLCAPLALCLGEAEAPETADWHKVRTQAGVAGVAAAGGGSVYTQSPHWHNPLCDPHHCLKRERLRLGGGGRRMVMWLCNSPSSARERGVGWGVSPLQLIPYFVTCRLLCPPTTPPVPAGHHAWCPAVFRGCLSDGPELQTAEKGQNLGKLRLDKVTGASGRPSPRESRLWGCLPACPGASSRSQGFSLPLLCCGWPLPTWPWVSGFSSVAWATCLPTLRGPPKP